MPEPELGWRSPEGGKVVEEAIEQAIEEEGVEVEEQGEVVEEEEGEEEEEREDVGEVTGLQEEEAWLRAVESGNLQQVFIDSSLMSLSLLSCPFIRVMGHESMSYV